MTLSEALQATASRCGNRDALIVRHQHVRFTWNEFDRETTRVAAGLAAMGLVPGDRIGIWAVNCVEWVLLLHGAARAGVILVNVNPAYRSHELRFVLKRSRIKALFLHQRDARTDYRAILEECGPPKHVVYLGTPDWDRMVAAGDPAWTPPHAEPNDVTNIQYTSGTTGSPKGVLLTHRNILNNGLMIGHALRATEMDRICVPVPLYHCFGCVIGAMVSLATGAAMILPAAQFDATAALLAVHEERATAIYGVPTMFIAELEHPNFAQYDLTSLRTGIMAGSACPIEVMRRVCERMHCPELTIAYGQTEASPVATMPRVDDSLETRVTTIGSALPNTELLIVHPETREPLPMGQIGEICIRGYLVMKGYDDEPDATAKTVNSEGWLHTGDLGSMQEDGNIVFRGRAKDMILRGGENIYPREIEEFLYTHPKVSDVQVYGVPDRKYGEQVMAAVKVKPGIEMTEDEVRDFCRGRIANYKVPKYVKFVDSFPMTASGKIQKFKLREMAIRELQLEDAGVTA